MTRKEKITKAKQLLTGEQIREQRVFRVIDRDGVQTCSDPGYPNEVLPHDIVFHITVLSEAQVKEILAGKTPFTTDELKRIESGTTKLDLDYSNLSDETLRRLIDEENPFNR